MASEIMGAAAPRSRIVNLLLAVLLLWSVALRVWLGTEGLSANHYWDERYNVRNVRQLVVAGQLEPVSYYYTALSYLPQAALLAATQPIVRLFAPGFAWFDGNDLSPTGYLLCRLVQIAYGVGSIALTFVIGRRLFSPAVGLWAALFLASSPVHIRLSTFFKPDILLVFLTLLALLLALRAAAAPTWRRYLLAGAGVGLAMSSKLNGGPIALPIVLLALDQCRRRRSLLPLLQLAAAGIAAVAVFVLINPHVDRYLQAMSHNQELYARRGESAGASAQVLQVLRDTAAILASPAFHGLAVAALAAAGALLLVALIVRRRSQPDRVLPWLMLLSFPIGYTLIYAVATGYAKPNNFLPLLPMTALFAGLLVASAWSWASRRMALLRHPGVCAAAAALVVLAVAVPAQSWVYDTRTRTTWEVAFDQVAAELKPWEGRVAHFEQVPPGMIWRPRPLRAMVRHTPPADALAAEDLDQLDAAVWAAADGDGSSGSALSPERWRAQRGVVVKEVRPRLFRTRGPELLLLLRAPRLLEAVHVKPGAADEPGLARSVPLDPSVAAELVSVSFTLPRGAAAPRLRDGAHDVELTATPFGRITSYLSRRVRRCPDAAAPTSLLLDFPQGEAAPAKLDLVVYHWAADCGPSAAPAPPGAFPADAGAAGEPGTRR